MVSLWLRNEFVQYVQFINYLKVVCAYIWEFCKENVKLERTIEKMYKFFNFVEKLEKLFNFVEKLEKMLEHQH